MDFDIPPLEYVPPDLVDAEFFPSVAARVNPGILNQQLITACAMLNEPSQPIESALLLAGITRVGARSGLIKRYVPHNRGFHVFCTGDFLYKGIPIVRVDVPPLGAESLSTHYLNSTSVWTDHGCIVNATSKVAMSIVGVRSKLDGIEVVQFAMLLATGEVVHVRYDTTDVYAVQALGPAVFERVGDDLILLRGEIGDGLKHRYLSPVRSSIENMDCRDGVIVNANGFDYRVKAQPTVTLFSAFGKTFDSNNHVYKVTNTLPPDGLGDFVVTDERVVEFKKLRPDRLFADNCNSVIREFKAPNIESLVKCLPKGDSVEVDDCDIHIPYYDDIQEYRSASVLSSKLGPMSWNGCDVNALETSSDVAKRVARVYGKVNRRLIDQYCYVNNIFCNGAIVFHTRRDAPAIKFVQNGVHFSTVPFAVNNVILTLCYDELPSKLRNLRSASYCVPGRPPLVTLYISKTDNAIVPYIGGGDGMSMRICALLRQGPADSRTLAGILGLRAGEVNKHLYSRMDIFARVGSPLRWFMKSSSFIDRVEDLLWHALDVPRDVGELSQLLGHDPGELGFVLRANPVKFVNAGLPLKWGRYISGIEFDPPPIQ